MDQKSMNFIRMLIRVFQATVFKFCDILGGGGVNKITLSAQHLQITPAWPKNRDKWHEYHYN